MAYELTYNICIPLVKFSILVFYARIFPGRGFRLGLYGIGAFVIAWFITSMFAATFQCTPIPYMWDKSIVGGTCINITATLTALAILNMVTDVAILIMPMHAVWHLHVPKSQKIAVAGIFLLGGL